MKNADGREGVGYPGFNLSACFQYLPEYCAQGLL